MSIVLLASASPIVSAPAVFLVLAATIVLVSLRLWTKVFSINLTEKAQLQLTLTVVGFVTVFLILVVTRFVSYG